MKIIAIDAGNTHLRIAKIDTDFLQNIEIIHSDYEGIFALIEKLQEGENLPISVASVVPRGRELSDKLNECGKKTIFCVREMAKDLQINYAETLGIDRIVDAVAGLALFPERDLVVIDSGTATTVDCVSADRKFLGGFILPGIKITSEAIHEKTALLPKLSPYELRFNEMPNDTFSAVSAGLIADCAGGIEYAIDFCVEKLNKPLIIACGGGWEIVKSFVRREIKAVPELTLAGTAIFGVSVIENN
ncbi:MAG: type III pantothenate kinase [Chitinivibrionia bacterium]|nr:type III pantothenate kinase [Chitinivibrionia bacterium]